MLGEHSKIASDTRNSPEFHSARRTMNDWSEQLRREDDLLGAMAEEPLGFFATVHAAVSDAMLEAVKDKPPVYCTNMRHRPCPDCAEVLGQCSSANARSWPEGVGVSCAMVVLQMLAYMGTLDVDVDLLMEHVYSYLPKAVKKSDASGPRAAGVKTTEGGFSPQKKYTA